MKMNAEINPSMTIDTSFLPGLCAHQVIRDKYNFNRVIADGVRIPDGSLLIKTIAVGEEIDEPIVHGTKIVGHFVHVHGREATCDLSDIPAKIVPHKGEEGTLQAILIHEDSDFSYQENF